MAVAKSANLRNVCPCGRQCAAALGGASLLSNGGPELDAATPLNSCEKLNYMSVLYEADFSPSTRTLLHRFLDRPASLLWSSERLAKSIHRSVRTVERSLAELRSLGIITTVRRQRQTVVKVLQLDRLKAVLRHGVETAKSACAASIALLRRGNSLTRQVRRVISILDIRTPDETTPWRVQASPSASLLRSLAMMTGEKRRKP